jgi:gibberellin A4 carboxyl methyltransferase
MRRVPVTEATQGMLGGGYYDAHSTFQADVAASGVPLLKQAVDALILPRDGKVTIADYGCGEGRNSIAMLRAALGLLATRGAEQPVVLHNDLPTNDWAGLAANLSGPASYLREFPQARAQFAPHGFFDRITLPASITLGTSGSAAHWLSRQPPGLDMPRSLYRSDAPPAELAKILAQAASDWQAFLAARAEELQPSGVLIVQMLGADGDCNPVRVSAAGLLKLMNECALQLVNDGEISKEVYAAYCFPVVPRTVAEATVPLQAALADRLELIHCGLNVVPSPYRAALEKTGDVAAFARTYTAFTRAFSESSLRQGIFNLGRGDPGELSDRFYAMMEKGLAANPDAYPFDDLTLALILRRRN